MKQAEVRLYFDADILGLGKLIAGLRDDCTFPGDPGAVVHKRERPPCSVAAATALRSASARRIEPMVRLK